MAEGQEIPQARWENTRRAVERVKTSHPWVYEEPSGEARQGFFAGRRIIGRDTPINGGVYVGSGAREAIVVDDQKYPKELLDTYRELRVKMAQEQQKSPQNRKTTLQLIADLSSEKLGGKVSEVQLETQIAQLLTSLTGFPNGVDAKGQDIKVNLNAFMQNRAGVCRHRALLAGYLMEQLVRDKVIQGRVSVDRNTMPQGGHAWVRYEGPNRNVFIIDPSLGYVGPIEKAPGDWSYQRPP